MIPIQIDISGLVRQFSFSKEEVRDFSNLILDKLTDRYMYLWEQNSNTLKGTRSVYKGAMDARRTDDFTTIFELSGKGVAKLALMLEDGASPFDIKEGFSKSDKRKPAYRKNQSTGWYLTIPFRMATAGALAESSVFSGKMSQKVQKIVKDSGRLTIDNMPDELKIKGVRKEIQTTAIPAYKSAMYEHKNSIYEGLKQIGEGKNSHYGTFRRVSDKSYKNSWIHKGFVKRDFMGKSLLTLSSEIDEIINSARKEFLDIKFD